MSCSVGVVVVVVVVVLLLSLVAGQEIRILEERTNPGGATTRASGVHNL